jgi:hypothetical protein
LVDLVDSAVKRRNGAKLLPSGEVQFRCPQGERHKNGDAHPSARWNRHKAVWHCDSCGSGRGVLDLAERLGIADAPRATGQRETARWDLRDPDGRLVAVHIRLEPGKNGKPKDIIWQLPDGRRGLAGRKVADLPLYSLVPGLPTGRVVLVEGEKCADALTARGVVAVGTVCGAAVTPSDDVLRRLAGCEVILWPDADAVGRSHMARIAERLTDLGISHRTVDPWPARTDGEDAADLAPEDDLDALLNAPSSSPLGSQRFPFVWDDEASPGPIDWLVDGILPPGGLAIVFGPPGAGKSVAVIDLVLSLATGLPWLEHYAVPRRVPVAYLYAEGRDGYHRRVGAWKERRAYTGRAGVPATFQAPDLLDEAHVAELITALRQLPEPPKLVVIDTLARSIVGAEENSSKDIGIAVAACDRIRTALACAVVLVHHSRLDATRERGSTALRGAADTMLAMAQDSGDATLVTLSCEKQRDAPEFAPQRLRLLEVGSSVVLVPSDTSPAPERLTGKARTLLEKLVHLFDADDPPTFSRWLAAVMPFAESTFIATTKKLCTDGYVEKRKHKRGPRYAVTAKGRAAVAPHHTNEAPIAASGARSQAPHHTTPPKGGGVWCDPGAAADEGADSPDTSEDSRPAEPCSSCGQPGGAGYDSDGRTWCLTCWSDRCRQ